MKKLVYKPYDSSVAFLGSIFMQVILTLVFTIILSFIAAFSNLSVTELIESNPVYIFSILISEGAFVAVYFLINKTKKYDMFAAARIKKNFSWKNVVLCSIIAFVAIFGFLGITSYFDIFIEWIGYPIQSEVPLPLTNVWWLITNLLLLAVVPAICEELIFRGIVLSGFLQLGRKKAVIFSALFFMLIHGNIQQSLYQFIFGIILAIIVIKTANLVYGMIVHFINNATVVVWQYALGTESTWTFEWLNVLWAVLIAIATCFAIWLLVKLLSRKDENPKDEFVVSEESGNLMLKSELAKESSIGLSLDENGIMTIRNAYSEMCEHAEIEKGNIKPQKMNYGTKVIFFLGLAISVSIWVADLLTQIIGI